MRPSRLRSGLCLLLLGLAPMRAIPAVSLRVPAVDSFSPFPGLHLPQTAGLFVHAAAMVRHRETMTVSAREASREGLKRVRYEGVSTGGGGVALRWQPHPLTVIAAAAQTMDGTGWSLSGSQRFSPGIAASLALQGSKTLQTTTIGMELLVFERLCLGAAGVIVHNHEGWEVRPGCLSIGRDDTLWGWNLLSWERTVSGATVRTLGFAFRHLPGRNGVGLFLEYGGYCDRSGSGVFARAGINRDSWRLVAWLMPEWNREGSSTEDTATEGLRTRLSLCLEGGYAF